MRRLDLSICLVIFILFITATVIGQTNTDTQEKMVYIYDVSGISPDNAHDFLTDVQAQLEPYDVLVRVDMDERPDQSISLFFGADSIRVSAKSRRQHRLSVSPIIYPNETPPYCCNSNPFAVMQHLTLTEESYPLIVDLVASLGLYQAGFYAESNELLEMLTPEILSFSAQEVPTQLERFINFYKANNSTMLGDFDEAINLLENTIFEDGINGREEIINLAWLYIQTSRADDALSILNNQLNITTERVQNSIQGGYWAELHDILPRRAQLYALAFDYDSAIADMDAAIELAESYNVSNELLAELYTLRGEIVFLIYEWDRVLENFNTALELDPDYAPAYFQRGVLYYTMTERENALADFEHYFELAPDGQYAEQAQQYIDSIQLELEALGG